MRTSTVCLVWLLCISVVLLCLPVKHNCVPTKSKPCHVEPEPPGPPSEALYDGYIRSINWRQQSFLYESTYGYVRALGPICGPPNILPVWEGMRVSTLKFHWEEWQSADTGECFALDMVEHSPLGDLKAK